MRAAIQNGEIRASIGRGLTIAILGSAALLIGQECLVKPILAGFEKDRIDCLKEKTGRTTPPDDQLWSQINERLRIADPGLDVITLEQKTINTFETDEKRWKKAKAECNARTARSIPLFP